MRLRQRDLKPYVIKERISGQRPDGTTFETWPEVGIEIKANIQPAGGKLMAEMYGERLAYMLVAYAENTKTILQITKEFNADDKRFGLCIYTDDPDYKVVAIRPWGSHKVIDLEKVIP